LDRTRFTEVTTFFTKLSENKALPIIMGAAVGAYTAGLHLYYLSPEKPLSGFITVTGASSTSTIHMNATTFVPLEPPPPIVPPSDRQEQG
jgi:hypothetical protein